MRRATMADAPQMKPWIEGIQPYVPGKSAGADGRPLVKLSANENPLGTSPAALAARAAVAEPSRYPDPDTVALRQALGEFHGIDPERMVIKEYDGGHMMYLYHPASMNATMSFDSASRLGW